MEESVGDDDTCAVDADKDPESEEPEVVRGNSRKRKQPQPSIPLMGGQETRYTARIWKDD